MSINRPFDNDDFFRKFDEDTKGLQRKGVAALIGIVFLNLVIWGALIAGVAFAVVWVVGQVSA